MLHLRVKEVDFSMMRLKEQRSSVYLTRWLVNVHSLLVSSLMVAFQNVVCRVRNNRHNYRDMVVVDWRVIIVLDR